MKHIIIHSRSKNRTFQDAGGIWPLSINFKQTPAFRPEKLIFSAAVVIILATFLVYLPSFNTPFQFDDVKRIVGQKVVENLDPGSSFQYSKSRFLLYLTLGLNYYFGKYDVFGYHLFNLIIHILSSLLVFALSSIIFNSSRIKNQNLKQHSLILAFFSSMIFALHPIQTESVTYIWQRGESMTGMFYLLAIFLYAKFRLSQDNDNPKKTGFLFYAACIISIVLCSFTKPNSVTLPVAILFYEICFLSRSIKEFKGSLKYLAPILLFVLLPVALAKFDAGENKGVAIRLTSYYMPYYYTKLRVLANSLLLMAIPFKQTLEYGLIWSASLTNPISTLYSLIILLSLAVICIFSFRRNPLISFAISWFFLTVLVTTILFLEDIFFEHYLYLPLFGYSLIVPALSLRFADAAKVTRKFWIICLLFLIATYSFGTYSRNQVWKTEISLWEDAVKKSPNKARVHYTLGVYYFGAKRYKEALKEYTIALKLKPEYHEAYYRLGEYYFNFGDMEKSIWNYKKALEINPEFFEAYVSLGNTYITNRQYIKARECFNNALKFTGDQDVIKNINVVLKKIHRYE